MSKYEQHFSPVTPEMQKDVAGVDSWLYREPVLRSFPTLKPIYKRSPFAFLFKSKNNCALYNSLNIKKVFGGNEIEKIYRMAAEPHPLQDYFTILSSSTEGRDPWKDLFTLIECGFLVGENETKDSILDSYRARITFNHPTIGLMYLLITNNCNLRCKYCTIESECRKPSGFNYSMMDEDSAKKGIDLFASMVNKRMLNPLITYYGGEPMLNWAVMKNSLEYIRKVEEEGAFGDSSVDVSMVCNGTLITDDIAKDLFDLRMGGSISIDGLKHHHNAVRLYADGSGSFDDALRGYAILKNRLGRVGISCTLGPHNYKDIESIVEYFVFKLECTGFGFNIMKGLPPDSGIELPADEVTHKIIDAYKILRKCGIYEDRIMRKVKSFINETPWIYDCGGYGGQFALCADGLVGPCHIAADDGRFVWGHIDEPDLKQKILKSELSSDWCRRTPLQMPECYDCVGLSICGGGCADEAFVKQGDMFALDLAFCTHCKTVLEWLMGDMGRELGLDDKFCLVE